MAQRWFHYIFDPTYAPIDPPRSQWPQRVWQIKPFFEHGAGKSIAAGHAPAEVHAA